ncbi:matrix metalloproteinase-14-like [Patiria miniata]|uniref:Peptidase metallopeptidase domain-containing protein n=1 Tax=Patiria miniata TaxID=46514 RepID=A0A913Z5E1_PATMI|nr:matrix metalloproteinase-14-like [Patiria miniata]
MTGKTLLLSVLLVGAVTVIHSFKMETSADAMMYLAYYGYLKPLTSDDGTFMTEAEMKEGISKFQYMANVTITGEIDNATLTMMNMPRCGCPDVIGHSLDAKRRKRYSLGSRWSKTDLTFRIDSVTSDISSREDIDSTLTEALQVWSDVTPLTFTRVYAPTEADIVINFFSRDHSDGAPFDGPGGVLAHAFFPENGRAHFDEDENWTIETYSGINLFQVAAHEFGHNLGLGHSNIDDALMAPFYRGYVPNFQLHEDDIAGIQAHYGEDSGSPFVTMKPEPTICTGNVDAVTTTRDRSTYIFEGTQVWKFESQTSRISDGFPKPIGDVFSGLPDNVDAALYYSRSGKTYIFKGSQYWRVDNEVVDAGYPLDIGSNWYGLPDDLDAAFTWSGNGRIYFVKGDQYYRFNGRVDYGYPRPLSVWNIPGNQVGAAVQWLNSRTYFFAPSSDGYFRFNDRNFRVDAGYPQSTATTWQGCNTNLVEEPGTSSDDDGNGVSGLAPGFLALVAAMLLGIIAV